MQDQLYNILEKLIEKSNISIHKKELKLQLLSHPSYPSLHALTGVLEHMGIPNVALRLQVNDEALQQLPPYFIANITSSEKGDELVLVQKKIYNILIIRDNDKIERISHANFLSRWLGIIVAIEKDETVKEVSENPISKLMRFGMPLLAVGIISYFILTAFNSFSQAHFILSILGIGFSVYIVKQELGLQSETANSFCNLSPNTSCDAILNSNGARILGLFKLSDVSIVIFSGYVLNWLLFSLSGTSNNSIFISLSILSVPFVLFSVYYQAIVAKKWCPLCLGIVAVLMLQIGALFLIESWTALFSFTTQSVAFFTSGMLIVVLIWGYLKPILTQKSFLEKMEVAFHKFKRKFSLFKAVLQNGDKLSENYEIPGEMVFGNRNASLEIILVTSPFCYYCKQAHKDIHKLLEAGNDDLKVTVRFNLDPDKKESDFYKIVSQLLHIYHTKGEAACQSTLEELYHEDAKLEQWVTNNNIHYNPGYDKIMEAQNSWCTLNSINFTPALYLNEIAYPKEYERTDLLFFMDEMIEEQKNQNEPLVLPRSVAS